VGLKHHRSPPVSFSGTFPTVISVSGMMREEQSAQHGQQSSTMCRTGGPGPMDAALTTLTLTGALLLPAQQQRSDGRKRTDPSAQHCLYIGDYRRVTLDLSNLSSVNPQEDGRTLRRRTHLSSHLRRKGGLYAPHCPNSLQVRAQGLITARPSVLHHRTTVSVWYGMCRVYPGCIGWCIYRKYTSPTYPGGVYTGRYTSLLACRVHTGWYTSFLACRVYTTLCICPPTIPG